jgi:hypothetical protein
MRTSINVAIVCAAAASLVLPVSAQFNDRDDVVERCGSAFVRYHNSANTVHEPYTTKYIVSSQRLQADGTTRTTEFTLVDTFDSQGRWMNSTTVAPSPEEESPSTHICIYDPVAGIRTTWSVPGKQATQIMIAELESSRSSCAQDKTSVAEVSRSKPVVEDFGTQTIQGYVAQGFRTSRSIPTLVNGNRKTIVRSVEIWRAAVPGLNFLAGSELTYFYRFDDPWYWSKSENLEYFGQKMPEFFRNGTRRTGLLMREVVDDPRLGKRSEEMQDFRQGNPDPDLFQPPEGYTIVTKKAPPVVCPNEEAAPPTERLSPPAQ